MLIIRLQKVGRKNDPSFRVVVTDSKNAPQSGNFLEVLGLHDPIRKVTNLYPERITYWLSVGAKTSDTVHNLLIKQGIISGQKVKVAPLAKEPERESEESGEDETVATGQVDSGQTTEEEEPVAESPSSETPEVEATQADSK